jgi:hypothetical protein
MDEEQSSLDEIKGAYDAGDIDKVARLLYYETICCLMNMLNPNSRAKLLSFVSAFLEHVKQSGRDRFEPQP